jgi:transcriptional regulator with GAF, ATPase, and Fis domain
MREDDSAGVAEDTWEQQVAAAFVGLADTAVADFDPAALLTALAEHCVDLLGVTAAGVVLIDQRNALCAAAASSEAARLLEEFQTQNDEGPCGDCCWSGQPVSEPEVSNARDRWPSFATQARAAGFHAVHALPLRRRNDVIGALNLFNAEPGVLAHRQVIMAQALSDIATIGILQQRAIREREILAGQLQVALDSRIVVEQAKGVLAERTGRSIDAAFRLLRATARRQRRKLSDLATDVVTGVTHLNDSAH